ncbi:hypothetical protein MKJ04_07540 [Pontibacter sp. E15-1]|uniref:DUF3024 domain-containing protein n=1 Tax=Pontibacter sp. E15-1 TaxID=2919918 RepID=UPI001F4FA696|nr:hypothetical protein [Pontibacter sp. E15-1]MCJ8164691.1 hypothetical protein [Pontibacter sp. E15-1]
MAKKKSPKMWLPTTGKAVKPKIAEAQKQQVEAQCQVLIQMKKPEWVQPPNSEWGYVSDVYGKWYRSFFYFCATYRYASPDAILPEREMKFARLEYAGANTFHLAYFRHTGQWWQVFESLSLQDCLEEVEKNPIFWP